MLNISLTEKEVEILKKSINHCMETCEEGGIKERCPDCESLRELLNKLSK